MPLNRLLLWLTGSLILLGLGALILWPTGSGQALTEADETRSTPMQYHLRLGYNMPEGSVMHAAALRLAEQVKTVSDGRLLIDLYPNQALGNDHHMLEMARSGDLDMVLTPTAKLSISLPEMQYADLPFYFPSQDDVYALLDGEPGNLLLGRMARIGLVGLTFWGNGFKQFTANEALLTPEQFVGKRFRVMKSRLLKEQFEMLGAEAVPIDFHQVPAALRDGVVDGQENPLAAIVAVGIHKEQSHLILSSHAYLAYVLSVSESSFARLPASLQRLLIDSAREQTVWQRDETERREQDILQQIAESGVSIERLNEAQRQSFRDQLRPLVERFEPVIGADLIAPSDEYLRQRYAGDEVRLVGIDMDLSLASGQVGIEIKRGVELALQSVPELASVAMNNSGQPSRARRNMENFAANPRVIAALGGTSVATLREQLPLIDEVGIPVLLPWVVEARLFEQGDHASVFSIGMSSDHLAERIAATAVGKDARRVGLITENSTAGAELTEQLQRELRKQNLMLGGVVTVNLGDTQIDREQLQTLLNNSDYSVVALGRAEQSLALEQLAALDANQPILSLWQTSPALEAPLECLRTRFDQSAYDQLEQHYIEHYGAAPQIPAALARGYDAALLLAKSVEQLVSKELPLSRENLISQLEELPPVNGVIRRYEAVYTPTQHRALSAADYAVSQRSCRPDGDAAP
ncbi:DctP family TRAP transporter solute-binding subunit [Marinobacterium lutimaris]|uniref:Tripartite ATP-independent transporter solute receptor, DctP family n=1 Tax=Marinobacterium lutimaris TaxID=568106 RepID=A0A1H5WXB0_9GAMM|nr:DctP family TRAP transporter solute-binding subunit [Marinobacterium lutimaris]SEG03716.1 tripartite ATP-independent transporter solute receptor, DctP family [Marinobacterium lutimaris]